MFVEKVNDGLDFWESTFVIYACYMYVYVHTHVYVYAHPHVYKMSEQENGILAYLSGKNFKKDKKVFTCYWEVAGK